MANDASDSNALRAIEVGLISEIYTPSSVSLTICEFKTSLLSVVVVKQSEGETVVRFSDTSGAALDEIVVRDFLNRALELSVRAILQSSPT
jgi:hypothetical protein